MTDYHKDDIHQTNTILFIKDNKLVGQLNT